MVQISWSNIAIADLKAIKEYIARDSPRFARIQLQKIRDRVTVLKKNPEAGKQNTESEDPAIRELVEGNYRIIYEVVAKDRIHILLVHHGARDINQRLKK